MKCPKCEGRGIEWADGCSYCGLGVLVPPPDYITGAIVVSGADLRLALAVADEIEDQSDDEVAAIERLYAALTP